MNIGAVNHNIQASINPPQARNTEVKTVAKEVIASNATEEVAAAVATKIGSERNAQSNKVQGSASSLQKRVQSVEQINELLDKLNAKDKEAALSQKLKTALQGSEQALMAAVANSLANGEEPAVIFLSLEKMFLSGELSEQQKKDVRAISTELTSEEEYVTSIKVSFNIAEVTSEYFQDEELASQFRILVGKGNYEKLNTAQILSTLMESGQEENFDKFLNAYIDSLAKDFSQDLPIPSTSVDYLVEKFSSLSEVSATVSLLNMSKQANAKVSDRYNMLIDSPARLGKAILDYVQNPNQENINKMATEFMGVGQDKKVFFANKVLNMVNQLPMQIWEGDNELRNKAIDELIKYSSQSTSAIPPSFSRLNKSLESIM